MEGGWGMSMREQVPRESRVGPGCPGAAVTGSCELPDTGARKRTQDLCKRSAPNSGAFSPPPS